MALRKLTLRDRFERHVRRGAADECHHWTGGKNKRGYGNFTVYEFSIRAHRLAWLFENGPVGGLCVLHNCDNPSYQDNNTDKAKKGRGRKSARGLPFGVAPRGSRFGAVVQVNNGHSWLGTFDTPEEANAAALAEKNRLLQLCEGN